MKRLQVTLSIAVIALLASLPIAQAAPAAKGKAAPTPPAKVAQLYDTEASAIAARDYDKFIQNGSARFQTAITKPSFDSLCDQLSPALKAGYTSQFLTHTSAQGDDVYIWRMTLKAGSKLKVVLATNQGKVDGYFLQPDTAPAAPAK